MENNLIIGKARLTINSKEVAEMMQLRHGDLIRKIDGISRDFTERNIALSKYWEESFYKDASGKVNRCLEITELGCGFIANKTTSSKGNIFTAQYMDKFEEMKQVLQGQAVKPVQNSTEDIMIYQLQELKRMKSEVKTIREDFDSLPLLTVDSKELRKVANRRIVKLLGGKGTTAYRELSKKAFSALYKTLWIEFNVETISAIKRKDLELAKEVISRFVLPIFLKAEIENIA